MTEAVDHSVDRPSQRRMLIAGRSGWLPWKMRGKNELSGRGEAAHLSRTIKMLRTRSHFGDTVRHPCASRCTAIAASLFGASIMQKTLPVPSSNHYR